MEAIEDPTTQLPSGSEMPSSLNEEVILDWLHNYDSKQYPELTLENWMDITQLESPVPLSVTRHLVLEDNDHQWMVLPPEFAMTAVKFEHFCIHFRLGLSSSLIRRLDRQQDVKFIVYSNRPILVLPYFENVNYQQVNVATSLEKLIHYQQQALMLRLPLYPRFSLMEQNKALNRALLEQYLYIYDDGAMELDKRHADDLEDNTWTVNSPQEIAQRKRIATRRSCVQVDEQEDVSMEDVSNDDDLQVEATITISQKRRKFKEEEPKTPLISLFYS